MVNWVLDKLGLVWNPEFPGLRQEAGTGVPLYTKKGYRRSLKRIEQSRAIYNLLP